MEKFLKDKKINSIIFIFFIVVSLFFIVKIINEVKSNQYIGYNIQSPSIIYVKGKGEIKAIPDVASLRITLSKEGKTTKGAQDSLNKLIAKTIKYLAKTIKNKDIKSEYGGVSPKYSPQAVCYNYPCPTRNQKIIGYTATQSMIIKIRDVDNANEIRTGLTDLGITNINGPTFSIDNDKTYRNQARAIAIKNAKGQAIILAKDLGVKLVRIINFSENNNVPHPIYSMAEKSPSKFTAPAPKLPKGENTVTSNVTITYEIK